MLNRGQPRSKLYETRGFMPELRMFLLVIFQRKFSAKLL